MEQLGEYKTDIRRATSEEVTFFRSKVGKRKRSGTVIIVKNCDRFDVNFTTFVKQMKSFIGLTYKNHINKGICFTVNDLPVKGDKVVSLDPLMRDFEKTYVITDREGSPVEYQLATGQRKTAFIEVSASVLPRPDANGKGKIIDGKEILIPLNQTNQGIYFYREGRMVGQALNWNNVFGERHNSKNRVRIEINCKSDLDDEIRMNFQKGNVSPTTNLKNQLEQIIEPIMVEMRERLKLEEGETILGQENKSTSVKGKTIEMVISNPKRNNQNGTTPFKVSFKNKEIKNANSVEDLLVAAQKIANILEDENVPDEIKNKFRETLGFVMTTV
jgi:hypothetical protein